MQWGVEMRAHHQNLFLSIVLVLYGCVNAGSRIEGCFMAAISL